MRNQYYPLRSEILAAFALCVALSVAFNPSGGTILAAEGEHYDAGITADHYSSDIANAHTHSDYFNNSGRYGVCDRFLHIEQLDEGYELKLGHGKCSPLFKFDGWIESGVYANSHGSTRHTDSSGSHFGGNGPMHVYGNQRTDFTLQQIYLYGEKEMDTTCGFDWGFRTDMIYGADGVGAQCYGDRSFDYDWATNDDGYGLAMYQLYASVGYKKLSVRGGKFITPVGWEAVASKNNFFYSHSYCYWLEPSTHVGALADYAVNDKLTLTGGWTAGCENGFENRFNDTGFILGFTYHVTDKTSIHYYVADGKTKNGTWSDGTWRLQSSTLDRQDYFVQSLCFEWRPTDRFTYMFQYNLRNDTEIATGIGTQSHLSSYGINNHLIYRLTDNLGVGVRAEWLRDNGGYVTDSGTDYLGLTLGFNWNPSRHWSIRPEIRYDQSCTSSVKPFNDGRDTAQISGGLGILYMF